MDIALISSKSAEKVKSLIISNIDNVEIMVFPSLQSFVTEANTRTITVDRFIILQDAVENVQDLYTVVSKFSEFVLSRYGSSRLVTISKKEDLTKLFSRFFIDDIYVHILVEKATPSLILEVVTSNVKDLNKKYGYKPKDDEEEVLSEVLDNTEKTEVKENNSDGGWLSKIFKKSRGKGENNSSKDIKHKDSKHDDNIQTNDLGDDNTQTDDLGDLGTDINGINDVDVNDFEDQSNFDSININFDGDIGFNELPKEIPNEIDSQDIDKLDFKGYENEFEDNSINNVLEDEDDSLKVIDLDEKDDSVEVIDLDEEDKNNVDSLDVYLSKKDIPKINIFEKDLRVDIDVKKINKLTSNDLNVKDVDLRIPDIDLEKEVEKYEKSNIKVVEKIVEVEKQVQIKGKRLSNVILITGDRKVGKTSVALKMCKELAKNKSILYVDMDIDRKGSLLYFGFDKILDLDEKVQNGLYLVKSEKALDFVTYFYTAGNFHALLSMFGYGGNDGDIEQMQYVLSSQKVFDLVVIDCQINYVHLLKDVVYVSDIYLMTSGYLQSVYNVFVDLIKNLSEKDILQVLRNSTLLVQNDDVDYADVIDNVQIVDSLFSISNFYDISNIDIQKYEDIISYYK